MVTIPKKLVLGLQQLIVDNEDLNKWVNEQIEEQFPQLIDDAYNKNEGSQNLYYDLSNSLTVQIMLKVLESLRNITIVD